MKKILSRLSLALVASLFFMSLVSCGAGAGKKLVVLKYPSYQVGTNASSSTEKDFIDSFKAKYGKEIDLQVEDLPSDQIYLDKLKVLAAAGDMPDLCEGKAGLNDILIKAKLATPFNEYLDADPAWKAEIGEAAIKANSRDGKVWSISKNRMLIGYFYNKEHFAKAGIKPAETWDEFLSNCEKLKMAGITPLALMTGEDAWTTALILASYVGTKNDAGNKQMNTMQLREFNTPEFIEGLKYIKTLLAKYTTKDALGANYSNAANNFLQGKTAMIANGPWMIPDFSDASKTKAGLSQNVGVAMYPEKGMFSGFETGFMLTAKTKEKKAAAVKMIKHLTDGAAQVMKLEKNYFVPLTANVSPSDEFKAKNPMFMDIVKYSGQLKYTYQDFGTITYANINDAWQTLLPELLFEKITAEEMVLKLNDIAAKN